MSNLFKLNSADFIKGLIVAVLAAVATWFAQVINLPGFDFGTIDWGHVLKLAVTAGVSYLGKNLLTDDEGKVVGMNVKA